MRSKVSANTEAESHKINEALLRVNSDKRHGLEMPT